MLWKQNLFLQAFASELMPMLSDHLKLIEFQRGTAIQSNEADHLTIFPITAVFATVALPKDAPPALIYIHSANGAICGRHGDAPIDLAYVLNVIGAGYALQIQKTKWVEIFGPVIWSEIYAKAGSWWILEAMTINAACFARHHTDTRVARLIAHAADAFGSSRPITLTHSDIGSWLGVRRETISPILESLEKRGVISLGRSQIQVVDTKRLHSLCCSCFQATQHAERLLFDRCLAITQKHNRKRSSTPALRPSLFRD